MQVEIFRIDNTLELPHFETSGSFGFDFLSRKTTKIPPSSRGLIPGNIIIKCPPHLALLILPRSSLFKKTNLIFPHSIGLIDKDYCGGKDEIMIQVFNLGKEEVIINRGEKIAQGLFVKTEKVDFTEIPETFLGKNSRGGFGSTDTKN
ncbi:dUTP diphosphatase [Candidatus Gracilibacteria bacterium]|nr:dUTP diphosphatase [Candidatus Gracilibacteria bacterium]